MNNHTKQELKPVTTQEIVDAIDELIAAKIDLASGHNPPSYAARLRDRIELSRRTIADGLRYHSAARGVVVGEQ